MKIQAFVNFIIILKAGVGLINEVKKAEITKVKTFALNYTFNNEYFFSLYQEEDMRQV